MRALEAGSLIRRGRLTGPAAIAVAAALVLGLAGCGDGESDAAGGSDHPEQADGTGDDGTATSRPPETTAAADTTTTTLTPEQQVLADYRAAVDAVTAAYDPPNPEHPDLLASFSGDALRQHQVTLREYRRDGLSQVASRRELDPQVTSLVGDTATIRDCVFEITEMLDTETREPMNEPHSDSTHIDWEMERIEGTWKIVAGTPVEEPC